MALTGAGVSAESGVPTFRGPGGLWKSFRAEDLATPEGFSRDPTLVWEWYSFRRTGLLTRFPNAAHKALASFEDRHPNFLLVTQNVDGLHAAAGSRKMVELHGNIWHTRCTACAPAEDSPVRGLSSSGRSCPSRRSARPSTPPPRPTWFL